MTFLFRNCSFNEDEPKESVDELLKTKGAILCGDGKLRIEINSIEEVLDLVNKNDCPVIIEPPDEEFRPNEYAIVIRDTWYE